MTVLHISAWRCEPYSIANVLESGAKLTDCTLDNQTALDISRRLTKKACLDEVETQKERLVTAILEQAAKPHTPSIPSAAAAMLSEPVETEQELMSLLLYLENRGKALDSPLQNDIFRILVNTSLLYLQCRLRG